MTITLINLVGTRENLDLTIKDLLSDNWDNSNITSTITPQFESDTEEADNLARNDDSFIDTVKVNYVSRTRFDIDNFDVNGDDKHAWVCELFIEIKSQTLTILLDMEDEVNRILWEFRPNGGTRLNKSDGSASEVAFFEDSEVEFERLEPETDEDYTPISQASLMCVYYKTKT